ncbi:MAG: hypothetical protein AB1744_11975, partial [Candidatus Zixiibacteriota bacterium]
HCQQQRSSAWTKNRDLRRQAKKATLIVADGDILNPLTHQVIMEFIDGRRINLDNKHRDLYRKYRQKHYRPSQSR